MNGDYESIEPHGEKEGSGCDEPHQQESRDRPEEIKVINRTACERNAIEDYNSCRTQCLRKNREAFARHHHAADQQTQADEETNRYSQDWRARDIVQRVIL